MAIVTQYTGFHINELGRIVYDYPAERTFETPSGTVTGTRIAMTELGNGDRFIGPDEKTTYEVTTPIAEHANGWLDVRDVHKPHRWISTEQGYEDEGFFAYSYPASTFVHKI